MKTRTLSLALIAGIVAWGAASADPVLTPVSQEAYLERVAAGADAPFVLDVRSAEEYVTGHVPGAVNIPHDQLAARLDEVPKDKAVLLYCRSGKRAGIAGQVLADNGYQRLQHLEGDMAGWIEKGRPVERPRDAAACVAALSSGGPAQQACAAH